MGNRAFKRQQLKRQYEVFCKAWNNEKVYQRYTLSQLTESQAYHAVAQGYINIDGNKIPLLGHKPTFAQWSKAQQNAVNNKSASPDQVTVTDSEWGEAV